MVFVLKKKRKKKTNKRFECLRGFVFEKIGGGEGGLSHGIRRVVYGESEGRRVVRKFIYYIVLIWNVKSCGLWGNFPA